ncbi:response regulator [Noviherbaspirillum suwonense]|jgi:CheY-like chemotaxis protein|uniref:Response regulator receiver domain-containing protein n=1 Tax=Noviherbaspirillum suwonense TaxID=1224511 RepID=A0ABY1QS61_9BURK|nr:response regulator [Noviherbaspirillum suwonense]SMP79347.1 Response regulator receiver domain-containing protein [Noviherbaspirillum suwonense]
MPHLNIVVIEDDADLRETMKELLEIEGFTVDTAENGQEGLSLIERSGPPCLILLDMMMPVMNGWEFLEAVKRDCPPALAQTQVAVVSAAADMADVQRQYGCTILRKPVNLARLFELAHAACDDC